MRTALARSKKATGRRKGAANKLEVFIDGASRGNPGPASSAVVVKQGKEVILECGYFLADTTNNVAEYTALLKALELLGNVVENISPKVDIIINSDSELLVKQLSGEYRVKDSNLKSLFEKARQKMKVFKKVELRHIPREQNKEADGLANRVLNLQEDIT